MGAKNYERAAAQERRIAARLTELTGQRFERVPGSGSHPGQPGDVIGPEDLIQAKLSSARTNAGDKSIRILKEDLEKIVAQATQRERKPALIFTFKSDRGMWVTIPVERYAQLLKLEKEHNGRAD